MQKITESYLVEKHSLIFQDRYASLRDSCIAFGIECGPGWYMILDVLFEKITQYCETEHFPSPKALQIKEKFGNLRVYLDVTTPYFDGLISMSECLTDTICEVCGAPARLTGFDAGWLEVRCPDHSRSKGVVAASSKAVSRVSTATINRPFHERRVPAYTKDGESIAVLDVLNLALVAYCDSKAGADVKIKMVRIEDGSMLFDAEGVDEEAQGILDMAAAFWERGAS